MKIRIEASPGELEKRSPELFRVLRHLINHSEDNDCSCSLEKAFDPNKQIKQTTAQFEYPVLEGSVKEAKKRVIRLRNVMMHKISQVLEGK
jgi:hypothetical protein